MAQYVLRRKDDLIVLYVNGRPVADVRPPAKWDELPLITVGTPCLETGYHDWENREAARTRCRRDGCHAVRVRSKKRGELTRVHYEYEEA